MTSATDSRGSGSWRDTAIWVELEQRSDADNVKTTLRQFLPKIETILAKAATSPPDFTLHDADHSFRVANRMTAIMPAGMLGELCSFELAHALLSAYLHDIGMTPEREKVAAHHRFLLTGDRTTLSQTQIDAFQTWLDDQDRVPVIPLCATTPTPSDLLLADELTTYYCRAKHNDWSEEWIRANLAGHDATMYGGWIDDLVALCRSHHEGYEELRSDRFAPRIVGGNGSVLHLRYLACLLRVADILEFDPERTPEVIFQHRGIARKSRIFWHKDRQIAFHIDSDKVIISSRPSDAYLHRAVETTADDVERELGLCRRLAEETHFEQCPGIAEHVPHRWKLQSHVYRDIQPNNNAYEYIDGSFRPNTRKLLELLTGVELYGNPLAAIRELLQNAFDAVREQSAYERLGRPNPADPRLADDVATRHRVDLRLENQGDETWLSCTDDGVGMTKEIIKRYLLVTGAATRHDIRSLERRCRAAGFELGRTGQFGIGVLSYFMIADRVEIETRRSQDAGDAEATGWYFETTGVGAFGELRRKTRNRGTLVRLRLRIDRGFDHVRWYRTLREFLQRALVRLPCQFQLTSSASECESLTREPGWVMRPEDFLDPILPKQPEPGWSPSEKVPFALLSQSQQRSIEETNSLWNQIRSEARERLRWLHDEGELPNALGRYRFHIPYFELEGGNSLSFLRIERIETTLRVKPIGRAFAWVPESIQVDAWKGIGLIGSRSHSFGSTRSRGSAVLEIDWTSPAAGQLAISRNELRGSTASQEVTSWIEGRIEEVARSFSRDNSASAFDHLNRLVAGPPNPPPAKVNWLAVRSDQREYEGTWEEVGLPATTTAALLNYQPIPPSAPLLNGRPVTLLRSLGVLNSTDHHRGICWTNPDFPPDRIVQSDQVFGYRFSIAPIWTSKLKPRSTASPAYQTSRFPPGWRKLCGVLFDDFYWRPQASGIAEDAIFWNPAHPIVKAAAKEPDSCDWVRQTMKASLDPLPHRKELLSNRCRASAWIMQVVGIRSGLQSELWAGLNDRDPEFLICLWHVVLTPKKNKEPIDPILFWIEHLTEYGLRVLTPQSWNKITETKKIIELLPEQGDEWLIRSPSRHALGPRHS